MKQLEEFEAILQRLEREWYWEPGQLELRITEIKRIGFELIAEMERIRNSYSELAVRAMELENELLTQQLSMEQQEQLEVCKELNEMFNRLYNVVYGSSKETE